MEMQLKVQFQELEGEKKLESKSAGKNEMITSISHLPLISLCEFDGDTKMWTIYIVIPIDGLLTPKDRKFCYLIGQLKGKAKLMIEQFA